MRKNYIVVGSGLTGAVIARILVTSGNNVVIFERRSHIGGNLYDYEDKGIMVHKYGPHYFRTSNEKVWKFVNKFSKFYKYEACVKSFVNGRLENWPIAQSYIIDKITKDWKPVFTEKPRNLEESALSIMPWEIYNKFVKGYNEKQWGVSCVDLSKDLVKRFDVRYDDDPKLTPKAKYQGIPKEGYTKMIKNMIKGIVVFTNCDYLKEKPYLEYEPDMVIYTGPIDEYYNYVYGKLQYRSQKRKLNYYQYINSFQGCAQVNYPSLDVPYLRKIEWKYIMEFPQNISGTIVTEETTFTPENPNEYEYPFPDSQNRKLYDKYKCLSEKEKNIIFCGRLGKYSYYDMDKAIEDAIIVAKDILNEAI